MEGGKWCTLAIVFWGASRAGAGAAVSELNDVSAVERVFT
jgi:hypothetical protein